MLQTVNSRNAATHVCGFYFLDPRLVYSHTLPRRYLPLLSLSAHSTILSSVSRTILTQTFVNPNADAPISELRYTFPLYDGASVVGFTCTVNRTRVIHGVVKEKNHARAVYNAAVSRGQTAGLLEQLPDASDVFTTTIGNVPVGAEIKVDLTYLTELKHDAQVDGIRFTIPTSTAPRYGDYPGDLLSKPTNVLVDGGISIVVDVEMPQSSSIRAIQSPSHPIAVTLGSNSTSTAEAEPSLRLASATLALNEAQLDADFVLQVVSTNTANPVAILETHPTISNHRALMTTLVPKFNLPSSRPEIVFICDRSGSMGNGGKMPNLKAALHLFLKSLPVGVKFNICSFGSRHSFLFPNGSETYDELTLNTAMSHVDTFTANYFGTEMFRPIDETIKRRYKDMDLEVFLLTDGDAWAQERLLNMVNEHVADSKRAVRLFTLGIGNNTSHALIEGLARAGNGFSQSAMDNEKIDVKVIRMLKAALMPHVWDCSLEIKYGAETGPSTTTIADDDDDFEIVERVIDSLKIDVQDSTGAEPPASAKKQPQKPMSLFDESANPDVEMEDATLSKDNTGTTRYSRVPPVPPPKLLQAPFQIPSLIPFNRTSVYLLMSPETTQKPPKSVVLRATSHYGPLELEIPVTVASAPGETIHQLAARKAVKELEEGRGWIFHAKTEDGRLLKDKFGGRFSDMVEREAVRLGVQFQVGGKWCSFVAVEDESEGETETHEVSYSSQAPLQPLQTVSAGSSLKKAKGSSTSYTLDQSHSHDRERSGSDSPTVASVLAGSMGSGMAYRATKNRSSATTPARPQQQQAQMQRIQMHGIAPLANPFMYVKRAPSSTETSDVHGMADSLQPRQREDDSDSDWGSDPEPAAAPSPAPSRSSVPGSSSVVQRPMLGMGVRDYSTVPPASSVPPRGREGSHPVGSAMGSMGSPRQNAADLPMSAGLAKTASPRSPPVPAPLDLLQVLVALQTFQGSWVWSNKLLTILSIGQDVAATCPAFTNMSQDIVATTLVVAFLNKKLGDQKDAWEMVADKAMDWLEAQPGVNGNGEKMVEAAQGLL